GDADNRLILVHRPDRLSDGGGERSRVTACADYKPLRVIRPKPLRGRGIDRIRLTQRQRCLLHIADDADNDVPRSIVGAADAHTLADGILIGERVLGERLADEHWSHWRTEHVTLLKQTAATERNAHRLEGVRSHCL